MSSSPDEWNGMEWNELDLSRHGMSCNVMSFLVGDFTFLWFSIFNRQTLGDYSFHRS